jgi:hypothetical protein
MSCSTVADAVEIETELRCHGDGKAHDLLGVLARVLVLRLECVGQRRECLAVQALGILCVLEAGDQRADLRGRELSEVPLEPGERTRPHVVDLDQAPGARLDDDRDEQDGVHLHLAEHEELGRVGAGIIDGDGTRDVRLENGGRRRIVREVVRQAACDLLVGDRVVSDLLQQPILEAGDKTRLGAKHQRQLAARDPQHPLGDLLGRDRPRRRDETRERSRGRDVRGRTADAVVGRA